MLLMNCLVPQNGQFTLTNVRLENGVITEVGEKLHCHTDETCADLSGDFLLPGFVDVHIHAYRGHDTMDGEEAIRFMSRELYEAGVAAFLPTTMSATVTDTNLAIRGIHAVMAHPEQRGAKVLGAHMEAPFLNSEKAGAQLAECLCSPSWLTLLGMTENCIATVKLLTLAPELHGADDLIRRAVDKGITISIGHTAATAEEVHHAADVGASHVTHTFNAQSPLNHRAPGVPGAAMVDDRLYTEFIADGVHLHEDIVRLIAKCKGASKAVAITDAMEAAGMPDGEYSLGGQPVYVNGNEARLKDGTLAGSVLTMKQALHNLIHRFGVTPIDAVRMCTETPAESIGEHILGRVKPGSPAPLTRWSHDWEWLGIIE